MVNRIASTVLHETRRMLPPTIFFLVSLNLLVLTVSVLSDDHEASAVSHAVASIGALLMGKAVLLAEMLPFFNRRSGSPLIYPTLWKAFLYFAVTMVLHLLERLVTHATDANGLISGVASAVRRVDWGEFLIVQMWLAILFMILVAAREAVREIGPTRVRRMFFADAPLNERELGGAETAERGTPAKN